MARVSPKQNRFSRGQISAKLHGSQDLELYYTALEICRNYIVDGRGMLDRRPGTRLYARTKDDGPAVLIPFAYSPTQAYVLEMGTEYMRAIYQGGLVLDGAVPFETSTPYDVEDMGKISFHQMRDVLWMAHGLYPFQAVRRVAVDEFSIANFPFRDGPYLDLNVSVTSLRLSQRGSLAPIMTANNAPSGTVEDSEGNAGAWKVFDGVSETYQEIAGQTGWFSYDPGGAYVVDAYRVSSTGRYYDRMPTAWVVEGWDGSAWIALDSRSGESSWNPAEQRVYFFANENAYLKYRFRWTGGSQNDANTVVGDISFNIAGDFQTPFNLTASSTDGINDGAGFQTSDVGRQIRIMGSDNIWRYVVIVSRTSSTVVTVRLYGASMPDTARISRWRMGAISGGNYPEVVTIHENRLVVSIGNKVFMTRPGDYDNMAPTEPDGRVIPDSAIVVEVPAYNSKRGAVSTVTVLKSYDYQLVVGTPAGNFTIQSNSFGEGLTSENVTIRPQEGRGAARLEPEVIGASIVFAHNTSRKLMGTYEKGAGGRLGAQDLSLPADDLALRGIKWMTFQDDPHGILWVGMDDGSLTALTIQPEEKVQAWHTHRLGGDLLNDGRRLCPAVESGCVITGPGGKTDVVHLVVKRTIGGETRRFIEGMEPFRQIGDDLKESFYLDGALKYEGNTDETAMITLADGVGPLAVRTFSKVNCPVFEEEAILAIHDGNRWHRGRVLSDDGASFTWLPVSPNAPPAAPDGRRWHFVDGEWVQLEEGAKIDVFLATYEDLDQTSNIWKWSIGLETITGLEDYEGHAVDLLVDGVPTMGVTVVGGEISGLAQGTIILVGFHSPSVGKLLSIEAGSQNGSAQGKQRPVYETVIDVLDSYGLEAGTAKPSSYDGVFESFQPLSFPDGYAVLEGEPLPAHTGLVSHTRDENSDNENPSVAWRQVLPLPSFIRGIITRLSESDGK